MEFVRGIHNIRSKDFGCVVTIGNFDGCHLGHKSIVLKLIEVAKQYQVPACVVTFEPLPHEVLSSEPPSRLMSLREKIQILRSWGVDRLICLKFDKGLMENTAQSFISSLLAQRLGIKAIVVGQDFNFGFGRQGNNHLLEAVSNCYNFSVHVVPNQSALGERTSSTKIRQLLSQGECEKAKKLLGRSFTLTGRVVKGLQQGRMLGFPTANLNVPVSHIPVRGVFVVKVQKEHTPRGVDTQSSLLLGKMERVYTRTSLFLGKAASKRIPPSALLVHDGGERMQPTQPKSKMERVWGVANVGRRPTLVEADRIRVEVHLLDFCGDLYGEKLLVSFIQKLREEKHFASLFELKAQIENDISQARRLQQKMTHPEGLLAEDSVVSVT
ncbi:MAG TPA: riboflavin biosynthesis protein RibF [Gammaproteobacteria bacterium]|nr:riboflavin biosynthesis protein RibF [Gammaproteobacteria bacterium]